MPRDGSLFEVVGRKKTRDMMTYDQSHYQQINSIGDQRGKPFDSPRRTHDGKVVDSTGAFLVGELERLDPMLHEPLVSVSWSRDMDLRDDVTIGDEVSSFTLSQYSSAGGLGTGNGIGTGKSWMGRVTTQVSSVDVDISKITNPLRPWASEIKYSIFELETAALAGRPIDQQRMDALQLKHQMDIDEQVYYGDLSNGDTGLLNNSLAGAATGFPNGALGSPNWVNKSPDEILFDVNTAITTTWGNSAWALTPGRILIPPAQFGYISTAKISLAGNVSILKYLQENNLVTAAGKKLEIYPSKWCIGMGAGGTVGTTGTVDRLLVYTKEKKYVRFPMTLLSRTPVQYDGVFHKTTFYCRLGRIELVYPETNGAYDGL